MIKPAPAKTETPYWSLGGVRLGLRMGVPVLAGMLVFGIAVGTAAARKGLSFFDSVLMNVVVYAGVSQLVALEIWPERLSWGAIAAIAAITAVVNARLILMSAAMQPWLGTLPSWQAYALMFHLTDPGWLLATRYRSEGGNDVAVFAAMSMMFLAVWMVATTLGYVAGGLIANPKTYGLDLAMPVFFAAMLIPLWRGRRRAVGWVVAGGVALAVAHFVPGWWFIIAGSVTGAVAGGLLDERDAGATAA